MYQLLVELKLGERVREVQVRVALWAECARLGTDQSQEHYSCHGPHSSYTIMDQYDASSVTSPASQTEGNTRPHDDQSRLITPADDSNKDSPPNGTDGHKATAGTWAQGLKRFCRSLCCTSKEPSSSSHTSAANVAKIQQSPLAAVQAQPLKSGWDEGVFNSELLSQSIVPRDLLAAHTGEAIIPPQDAGKPPPVRVGTYRGTKLALTQMTMRIQTR